MKPGTFRFPWKIVAWVLIVFAANWAMRRVLRSASDGPPFATLILLLVIFGTAALLVFPWVRRGLIALVAMPFQAIFWPGGRFHEPPDDLLRKLRARVRDHQGAAVEPQVEKLIEAYGASAKLYELLYEAVRAQGRSPVEVLARAQRELKIAEWAALLAAVREIDATTAVVAVEPSPIPGLMQPVVENPPQPIGPKPRLVIPKLPDNDSYRDPMSQ